MSVVGISKLRSDICKESYPVVIVARNAVVREGLTRIIANTQFRVVATLLSVDESVVSSLPQKTPLLIVFASCHEPVSTARGIGIFRNQCPDAHIVVVAENHDTDEFVMSLRAGATAYLAKLVCSSDLIKSLELVISGQTLLTSAMLSGILSRGQERGKYKDPTPLGMRDAEAAVPSGETIPRLSVQEKNILAGLVAGNSNKVIARRIGIAEATVKVHVKSILRKIRALNRTQAAIWASRHTHTLESAHSSIADVEL